MEQIVLQTNLRFLLEGLNEAERGRLLMALLEENSEGLSDKALAMYQYIFSLQREAVEKRQKMRLLGLKSAAIKKQRKEEQTGELFNDVATPLNDVTTPLNKRKEPKENNINNKIKKIFISSDGKKGKKEVAPLKPFVAPSVDEVRAFVNAEGLKVEPEVFVDFYESHGWCVGRTPIKNWRATVRLWHRRAGSTSECRKEDSSNNDFSSGGGETVSAVLKDCAQAQVVSRNSARGEEEAYWHELMERVQHEEKTKDKPRDDGGGVGNDANKEESPFARFMRRIESNDLLQEERK